MLVVRTLSWESVKLSPIVDSWPHLFCRAVPGGAVAVQAARYLHGAVGTQQPRQATGQGINLAAPACRRAALYTVPSVTPRRAAGVLLDLRSWPRGLSLFLGRT